MEVYCVFAAFRRKPVTCFSSGVDTKFLNFWYYNLFKLELLLVSSNDFCVATLFNRTTKASSLTLNSKLSKEPIQIKRKDLLLVTSISRHSWFWATLWLGKARRQREQLLTHWEALWWSSFVGHCILHDSLKLCILVEGYEDVRTGQPWMVETCCLVASVSSSLRGP